MKKNINRMLLIIAFLAILFTMLLITMVYHRLFEQQVLQDLESVVRVIGHTSMEMEDVAECLQDIRLTLVASDGEVLYDSWVNHENMQNHGNRPEVVQAVRQGYGQDVRRSETLAKNTYYYAVLLPDGAVLRTSKEAGSILSIFVSAIPSLGLVLLVLVFLCMGVAHVLTGKLLRPIERLAEDLDTASNTSAYLEMEPFIDTIRKQHEDIMKNARMRQEFTANVTHELKTPLTSISGYAELIETGMASEADVERFAIGIRKSANRLLTLINDIIRLSELDSAEQKMVPEQVNLYGLAETCVDMLALSAEKHEVTITLEGRDAWVQGDRQMLEELLFNLCDNAIRYNNAGGTVQVQVINENTGVLLVVKDTGIGISKEHQERIFERFYRVDKSRSKSTGGTGLGLAIVKHILSLHGAQMELFSEPGKGTEYQIFFRKKAIEG